MGVARITAATLLSLSSVCASATPAHQTNERLCLVDEAKKDASFVEFRSHLLAVIERKDSTALVGMISPDVQVSIEGRQGIAEFIAIHRPANSDSTIWTSLQEILRLGGSFIEPTVFCAPFVRCPGPRDPGSGLMVVVLGEKVPAYSRPTTTSEVVASLACDVLPYDGNDLPPRPAEAPGGWVAVYRDGQWMFVEESRTRMLDDSYVRITKVAGRWLITTFL